MGVDFIVSEFTNMHAIISTTSSFDKTLLSVAEETSTNGTGVSKKLFHARSLAHVPYLS